MLLFLCLLYVVTSVSYCNYLIKYKKIFHDREDIYYSNLDRIMTHNQRNYSWKLCINQYTDMTQEEFQSLLGRKNIIEDLRMDHLVYQPRDIMRKEDDVNWIKYTTPVKNQGMCGSCWAFATIESHLMIHRSTPVELSEKQLVECDVNNQGCEGGSDIMAYIYAMNTPLSIELIYPYTLFFGKRVIVIRVK